MGEIPEAAPRSKPPALPRGRRQGRRSQPIATAGSGLAAIIKASAFLLQKGWKHQRRISVPQRYASGVWRRVATFWTDVALLMLACFRALENVRKRISHETTSASVKGSQRTNCASLAGRKELQSGCLRVRSSCLSSGVIRVLSYQEAEHGDDFTR